MLRDENPRKFKHWVALFGIGGSEKPKLSIEYVVRYKDTYNAAFCIAAVSPVSLLLGFQEIASVTKCVNADAMDPASVVVEVLKWLEKQELWPLILILLLSMDVFLYDSLIKRSPQIRNCPSKRRTCQERRVNFPILGI